MPCRIRLYLKMPAKLHLLLRTKTPNTSIYDNKKKSFIWHTIIFLHHVQRTEEFNYTYALYASRERMNWASCLSDLMFHNKTTNEFNYREKLG